LVGGARLPKDDARIECIGSIDELSSFLGLAAASLEGSEVAGLTASLLRVQRELYVLGAQLGRRDDAAGPSLGPEHVEILDREVEAYEARLPKLTAFIVPGGGQAAAALHVARAVCRRAERQAVHLARREPLGPVVIPYLNRLSLVLFHLARAAAQAVGTGDQTV
jgi:cob(I)alamin adenosyltransferase